MVTPIISYIDELERDPRRPKRSSKRAMSRIYCSSEHLCTIDCPNRNHCSGLRTKLLLHAAVRDHRNKTWYLHEYLNTISISRADYIKQLNISIHEIMTDFDKISSQKP